MIVQDSGIGMDGQTIEKIKAKNYYTTAGTSMEKGSGFGLMLCSDL
ncbi:ATP-binding protein, partial [Vibrio parahaemolyticus]